MKFEIMRYADESMLLVRIAPTFILIDDCPNLTQHIRAHLDTMTPQSRVIMDVRALASALDHDTLTTIFRNWAIMREAYVLWVIAPNTAPLLTLEHAWLMPAFTTMRDAIHNARHPLP
jgi:hypothetical protein